MNRSYVMALRGATAGLLARCALLLAGMALPFPALAQVSIARLAYPPGTPHADDYRIPKVSGLPDAVAARINLDIQYALMGWVPGHYPTPMISDDEAESGTTWLSFEVIRADSRVLTLAISAEYMGAHPSAETYSISFDVQSGQRITESDLLIPAGRAYVKKQVDAMLTKAVRANLAHPDPRRFEKPYQGMEDDRNTQVDAYKGCLERDDAYRAYTWGKALSVTESCEFPHMILALDDVGDVAFKRSYASLGPYLSDYGKCLLLSDSSTCSNTLSSPTEGVWHGSISRNTAITLVSQGATNGGMYFYDRIGTPISLVFEEAKSRQGHWVFTARGTEGVVTETLDLVRDGAGGFTGTWAATGKRALPVVLH